MSIFRNGLPRDTGHPLDSDIDRAIGVAKAHTRHDRSRPAPSKTKGDTSGPASADANTPQKRGWRR